ncbi:McrC family protein [Aquibium microcysteis]|uniref:McrC family protein n=1 Tax=Aquibium microcysteis TaxID=675281 RepID=UPI00165D239D|nr:calmodulin-binding protein [Aquibium microcysteis]
MTHLTVREWGRVGVHGGAGPQPENTYSRSEADALLRAAWRHPLATGQGTNILVHGRNELIAQQVVGVIAAPGCSLEILPKIDNAADDKDETIRARLVSMLDVALGLELGHGPALAMARQKETLLDILIRLFADRLLAESRRGLPRAYQARQEDLLTLRGRLDVVRQFTHHAVRPDRLACRFDSLAPDTPLLRIMKACVSMLRRHARAVETQRRLDELRFLLADVSDVPAGALPWSDVRIDRTNRRWERLLDLARLFLKREWQRTDHHAKGGEGITLLFAMNDLFEAYIATLARRALRDTPMTVRAQSGLRSCLVEEGSGSERFRTRPDILVTRNGETVMLIDTKWKLVGRNPEDGKRGVSQADVYQMMAYARLYDCRDVMLLYPHHAGLGPEALEVGYTIQSGGERLRVASVDLLPGTAAVVQRLTDLTAPSAARRGAGA